MKKTKRKTLRGQITASFYFILGWSILLTIVTWGLLFSIFLLLIQNDKINPANYYEGKLPELVALINEQEDILKHEKQETLEQLLPLEGIDYQIVSLNGEIIYGTIQETYLRSEYELVNNLNTNLYDGGKIVRYYPLIGENGSLSGAIGLRYEISVLSANHQARAFLYLLAALAFVSPFVYFYIFAYVFGKRFSVRIEKPFNDIIASANKIRNHELDFSLEHIDSTEELNQLVSAFEEMKEALKQSLQQQWRLEQDRKDMVSSIAHDLKTPLTIIQGHVEGLLDSNVHLDARTKRYLHTIQKSCTRSIKLIRDLNEVAQLEQAQFTLHFSSINLLKWHEEKASQFQLLCDEKRISFQTDVSYGNEIQLTSVKIDVDRIDQLIDNIFMNSFRFTKAGGSIHWNTSIKGHDITFEMIDNGPGFTSEDTSKLFEKFYREDPSRTGEAGHSGLGLFIAQTIAKKHGGEISAENRKEGGARVIASIKNMEHEVQS